MEKFKKNDLVLRMMEEKGVDEVQIATAIKKDPSTIYRITAKKTVPSKTTLQLIADAFGFDVSYFTTGKMQEKASTKDGNSPWKDEAYTSLKQEVEYMKKKYDQILEAFLSGKGLGKQWALKIAERFRQAA